MLNVDFGSLAWTFILALFIFHFFLMRVFVLSAAFWKRVDYYWLAATILSVIAAIQIITLNNDKLKVDSASQTTRTLRRDFSDAINAGAKFNCGHLVYGKELFSKHRQANIDMIACTWFLRMQAIDESSITSSNVTQPLSSNFEDLINKKPKRLKTSRTANRVIALHNEYSTALETQHKAEIHLLSQEAFKYTLQNLYYLILFLLALRVTKVTADHQMERRPDKKPVLIKQFELGKAIQAKITKK